MTSNAYELEIARHHCVIIVKFSATSFSLMNKDIQSRGCPENEFLAFDDFVTTKTKTATHSCRTRKRAFHFYSLGVVRLSHAAARHVQALLYRPPPLLLILH